MPEDFDPALSHVCPYVDKNDPRCHTRFRMRELDAMYRYCLGGYYGCVLFHRFNREATYGTAASNLSSGLQSVTIDGRPAPVRRSGP